MPIIQTMFGGTSGKYWMLTIPGETVNSVTRSIRPLGGLVLDSSDNIFISTDSISPNTPLPDLEDPCIFKIDNKGELQFKKSLSVTNAAVNALQPTTNSVGAIALTSNGNIYLTYRSSPTAGLFQTNDQDFFIAVLDSTGDAIYGVLGNIDYQVFDNYIASRSDDYLWQVTVHREVSGPVEVYLHFLEATSSGYNQRATQRLNDYQGRSVTGDGFAVDSSNNAIIAGNYEFNTTNTDFYIHVQKFSGSGISVSRVWDKHIYSSEASKITDFHLVSSAATDSSDNIYIYCAITFDSSGQKRGIIKLNSSGTLQWAKSLSTNMVLGNSMVVDSNGNVYSFGGTRLIKFNSSGELQWIRSLTVSNSQDISTASAFIKLDSEENLVLTFSVASNTLVNNTYVSTTRVMILPNDGSLTGTYGDLTYSEVTGVTTSNLNLTVADSPLTSSNDPGADGGNTTSNVVDSDTTHTSSITLI